eukprot:5878140-Prymnesium_polylepis.3
MLTSIIRVCVVEVESPHRHKAVGQERLVDMVDIGVSHANGRWGVVSMAKMPIPVPEVDAR